MQTYWRCLFHMFHIADLKQPPRRQVFCCVTYQIKTMCANIYVDSSGILWSCQVICTMENFTFKHVFNTLRPRQNGRHFADDIFKCIFLNENVWIPIKISLKFVPKGPINNIPSLVKIIAWRRPGDKPLSEPMMVSLTTHICVTRPQWVKCPRKDNYK